MNSINRHLLEGITERGSEPCWRVAYLDDLRSKCSQESLDLYATIRNSDFPNGLIHDESCRSCQGTGLQWRDCTVGFLCMGCGQRGQRDVFETSSCLDLGDGFYEELIAEHEDGDRDWTTDVIQGGVRTTGRLDKKRCPLCIRRRREEALIDA